MDDTAVKAAIRLRGYPSDPDLTDAEIEEAIAGTQRLLKIEWPLVTYGSFTAFPNQQVYDVFNPTLTDPTTSQGAFPTGIWALELVWSPTNSGQSLDVFGIAPFLQGLSIAPGEITTYSFQTPTDFWMWDLNWNAFVKRFGPMHFEHVESRPQSPIRIFPKPISQGMMFLRFQRYRLATEIDAEDEEMYLTYIESLCCYAVGRKLAMVAGTRMGSLADDGKSAGYWLAEGKRKRDEGDLLLARRRHDTFSAAERS